MSKFGNQTIEHQLLIIKVTSKQKHKITLRNYVGKLKSIHLSIKILQIKLV